MAAKKKNNLLLFEFVGGVLAVIVGLLTLQFLKGSNSKTKKSTKSKKANRRK